MGDAPMLKSPVAYISVGIALYSADLVIPLFIKCSFFGA
jgi:hypothetical protein